MSDNFWDNYPTDSPVPKETGFWEKYDQVTTPKVATPGQELGPNGEVQSPLKRWWNNNVVQPMVGTFEDTSGATPWDYYKGIENSLLNFGMGIPDAGAQFLGFKPGHMPSDWLKENYFPFLQDKGNTPAKAIESNIGTFQSLFDPMLGVGGMHGAEVPEIPRGPKEEPPVKSGSSIVDTLDNLQAKTDSEKSNLSPAGLELAPEGDFWNKYATQEELPLTSSVEDIASAQNARTNQMDMFLPNQERPATPYNAEAAKASEDAAGRDAMNRAASNITYENVPPGGTIPKSNPDIGLEVPKNVNPRFITDENGIPVRQGMPQPGENAPAAPTPGNGLPLLDSRRLPWETVTNKAGEEFFDTRGTGERFHGTGKPIGALSDDYAMSGDNRNIYGQGFYTTDAADIAAGYMKKGGKQGAQRDVGRRGAPETISPQFNQTISRLRKNQGGFIDFSAFPESVMKIARATGDLVYRGLDQIEQFTRQPLKSVLQRLPQDTMRKIPGMSEELTGLIPKPDEGSAYLQKALAEGKKNPMIPKNWQSGALMASEKYKSAALQGVGRWLEWAHNSGEYRAKTQVLPMEKALADLPRKEFEDLHKILTKEMFSRERYDRPNLEKVLSEKQLKAYDQFRKLNDDTWEMLSKTREKLGLEPVTKEEAYAAAMRQGDYRQSYYGKDGGLVWHVASTNRLAAMKANKWLKEKLGDKIDWSKSGKVEVLPETGSVGAPKDVLGDYQAMMHFFDPDHPVTGIIQELFRKTNQERGLTNRGMNQRFMEKNNIRGFNGDKPWLTPRENAQQFFESQMSYLKNSMHWAPLQEALAQMEPILSNPELNAKQPNILKYATMLVQKQVGMNTNVFSKAEQMLTHTFGVSRSTLYHRVADLKMGTLMQMLGFSPGYAIATPLQGMLSVALHRYISNQGVAHNVLKTMFNSIADSSIGMAKMYLHEMGGVDVKLPGMSDLGKRAMDFADDNGIITKNISDEFQHLGSSKVTNAIKNSIGPTITLPEKVGRLATYMSFVHHLSDARNGLSEQEVFRKAGELTNLAMTDMKPTARPMIVDKLGAMGETSYLFHSYLFNQAHQMSLFAREAKAGRPGPLLGFIGTLMALGGAMALPFVNELDGTWNLFKNFVAEAKPDLYKPLEGMGLKGWIMQNLPTYASLGTVSQATGANMSSRFSPQFIDPQHPFSGLAAPIQEAKEQTAVGKLALNPTKRNLEQSIWVNAFPSLKGQMETHLDDFKNPTQVNGTQAYRKASDINNPATDYRRTPPDETMRKLGLTSTSEFITKSIRYINNEEQARVMTAFKGNFDKMNTALFDGDKDTAKKYAQAALKLIPDPNALESAINTAVTDRAFTPEERDKIHADSMATLEKIKRVLKPNANY